jgi:hypothetical protein
MALTVSRYSACQRSQSCHIHCHLSRQASRPVSALFTFKHSKTRAHAHIRVVLIKTQQTLKYNPASWRVPYDHVVFKDSKQVLVTYCLQLLLVLILYPIPEPGNGPPPKNFFRHFLGRLHRPQDFQFLVDGMTRILNQPVGYSVFVGNFG